MSSFPSTMKCEQDFCNLSRVHPGCQWTASKSCTGPTDPSRSPSRNGATPTTTHGLTPVSTVWICLPTKVISNYVTVWSKLLITLKGLLVWIKNLAPPHFYKISVILNERTKKNPYKLCAAPLHPPYTLLITLLLLWKQKTLVVVHIIQNIVQNELICVRLDYTTIIKLKKHMKYRNTRKKIEFSRSFAMVGRFAPRSTGAQNRYSAVLQKGIGE